MLPPVALIAGGLKNQSLELLQSILRRGVRVIIATDCNAKIEKEKTKILEYKEKQLKFITCDFKDNNYLNEMFKEITSTFGYLSILCNHYQNNDGDKEVGMSHIIENTFKGIQTMTRQNGGRGGLIINIASLLNYNDLSKTICVNETNYDIISFSHSFRSLIPYETHGIQVKTLCYACGEMDESKNEYKALGRLDLAESKLNDVIGLLERKDVGCVLATNKPIRKLYEVELEPVINAMYM